MNLLHKVICVTQILAELTLIANQDRTAVEMTDPSASVALDTWAILSFHAAKDSVSTTP